MLTNYHLVLVKYSATALACLAPTVGAAQVMSVQQDVHHDVSVALGELPKAPLVRAVPHQAEPVRRIPLPTGLKPPGQPDAAIQIISRAAPAKRTPAPLRNFPGLGQGIFPISVAPPDTNGAVGATQYVQWANASFAVFDKATGKIKAGPTPGNTLWSGFGSSCEHNDAGDGLVVFDKLANRWVISQFTGETAPFLQCVAVSTSPDATGTYYRYSFQYDKFNDFPKMGVWPDGYYVTFNIYDVTAPNEPFVGANACAYDRNAMLKGLPATQVCFQQPATVGGLLPADVDGTAPPPNGSPNYLANFGSNALNLYKFHVDFTTTSKSTFTGPTVINVTSFSPLCDGATCVPQPKVPDQLDSLADRLSYRLAYRNLGTHESLLVNHSVVAGTSGGIRWYEIRNPGIAPVVAQQSTFAPDASFRWMGSIAMDKAGDIALGYSLSNGESVYPSIAYTGRAATDAPNSMETEVILIKGTGSQNGGLSRWGDYSAMQIDPSDDCTFWYTQEYLTTTAQYEWSTRIGSFKFPNCMAAGTPITSPSRK